MKQTESMGRARGPTAAGSFPPGTRLDPASAGTTRSAATRVLIRPARPDDLEEATRLERRVWGGLAATLNELQRRLFALPEAFLLAELQRPGGSPRIVGLTSGLLWTRDFPRSYVEYERMVPSSSHNPRGDVLYLASIGVDEALRGRGIGLTLLKSTIEIGRKRHLKYSRLIANQRSQPVCARAGFEVVRPLPRLYREHRNLMPRPLLMEIPLL